MAGRMLSAAAALLALALVGGCTQAAAFNLPHREHGRDEIKAMVAREAVALGVPVALALAIAHAESDFDHRALSKAGARGVMQVMPATARGEYGIHADLLWDPKVNIRLGLHFFRRLLERYSGRVDLALSYYNGGSAVGDLPRARVIPATAGYVRRVQELRRSYERSWGTSREWAMSGPTTSFSRGRGAAN